MLSIPLLPCRTSPLRSGRCFYTLIEIICQGPFAVSIAGNLAAIKELLSWGTEVNVADHSGATPLAAALAAGRKDAAALLMDELPGGKKKSGGGK